MRKNTLIFVFLASLLFTSSSYCQNDRVNVDERFMLINTGFIIFESYENGVLQNLKTVIVPLSNGTAESIVRKETNYTYIVKFVDTIASPNITLFGSVYVPPSI